MPTASLAEVILLLHRDALAVADHDLRVAGIYRLIKGPTSRGCLECLRRLADPIQPAETTRQEGTGAR